MGGRGEAEGREKEVLLAVESGEVACRLQDSSPTEERGDGDDRGRLTSVVPSVLSQVG